MESDDPNFRGTGHGEKFPGDPRWKVFLPAMKPEVFPLILTGVDH